LKKNISTKEDKENYDLSIDPIKWTVSQVTQFIEQLTNNIIGLKFYKYEINGQALFLLTQEDLCDIMKIKLGPSKIILNEISKLRQRTQTFFS